MFSQLKNSKSHSKTQMLYKLLEQTDLYQLTKDIMDNDLKEFWELCQNAKNELQYDFQENPIHKVQLFLFKIDEILNNPFNLLMKQKIKSLLIELFAQGTQVPQIFGFIQFKGDKVLLKCSLTIEQHLKTMIKSDQKCQQIDCYYKELLMNSEELLIQITLNYLYEAMIEASSLQLNNNQELDEIYKITSKINKQKFSKNGQKIIELIENIKKRVSSSQDQITVTQPVEHNKKNQQKEQQITNIVSTQENGKYFIFKILLLLLLKQEIALPDIIKLFKISYVCKQQDMEDRKGFIKVYISQQLIFQISLMVKIKQDAELLKINSSLSYYDESSIRAVKQAIKQYYPEYEFIKFNQVIKSSLELLLKKFDEYQEQICASMEDSNVKIVLKKIYKTCGKYFQKIDAGILTFQNAQQKFLKNNMLEIGYLLYQIQLKIDKKNNSQSILTYYKQTLQEQDNDQQINYQRSIYEKQLIQYGIINPIFFKFIQNLIKNQIPFPYMFQFLKMGCHRLLIHYRIESTRKLTLKKKFIQFVKQNYDLTMTDDRYINVELLKTTDTEKYVRKEGLAWPLLLYEQCKLIYENRERFNKKLQQLGNNKDFQEIIQQYVGQFESNSIKFKLQQYLLELNNYIKQLNN
ncbi:unnamed protein product (macronuclear) [Paramecium tetraurelia]|uniref:VPS9 domain-containing protein n=1 Tax=Paramecium tetraurelia TaxID=5888 RepID=A0D2F3_PARTE|nr:uncharacterized protein GSPATT00012727001 [Paramecium tetraurelia]CAK77220.1 unnamed protein product [Paramecium tetraurelia]|eukprot:XP_001444617.1 hypothetical protein (macronuclear) [Paramecium tetraurelia strain d4-2]